MSVNIIVQARMSSTRLPGKVMMRAPGKQYSIVELIFDRLRNCKNIKKIILATSLDESDDILAFKLTQAGYEVVRGSLDDVLSRFMLAIDKFDSDHIVRVTADCPLIDPSLIDELINFHLINNNDYSSLALDPTYPDGLDAEVVKTNVIKKLDNLALSNSDREHVTHYIYAHQDKYKIGSYKDSEDYSHVRLTLDEPLDFEFFDRFIRDIKIDPLLIKYADIKEFIKRKNDDYFINSIIDRNEGLHRSLNKDLESE